MITVDKGIYKSEGTIVTIIAEGVTAIQGVCESAHEHLGMSREDALELMLKAVRFDAMDKKT